MIIFEGLGDGLEFTEELTFPVLLGDIILIIATIFPPKRLNIFIADKSDDDLLKLGKPLFVLLFVASSALFLFDPFFVNILKKTKEDGIDNWEREFGMSIIKKVKIWRCPFNKEVGKETGI